ncbi:4Fe-4S binding protein [Chloroflexota bacterium]
MPKYGFQIDYEFCVGCRSCEIACKQEHNRPEGESGICVNKIESEVAGGKLYYLPFFTDNCNLCGKRIARGQQPACAHNCWVSVIKFGEIEDLTEGMKTKAKMVLWAPH